MRVALFYVLLFLLYTGYHIISDSDPVAPIQKLVASSTKKTEFEAPRTDAKALGYCIIESEDLFSGSVYDYNKKQLPAKMSPIPCSECNQYVYKTDDQCSPYMYDSEYNSLAPNIDYSSKLDVFCDPTHPERDGKCIQPHGVCTIDPSVSRSCAF